ncbi:hypothetical protein [Streptomyces sp. NPDC052225]|uniref:hypothetical protein n=1 Tax=Streptomyces sp. NPDC052225 TaxID=3154949 RepID=UPI00343ADC4B
MAFRSELDIGSADGVGQWGKAGAPVRLTGRRRRRRRTGKGSRAYASELVIGYGWGASRTAHSAPADVGVSRTLAQPQ